MDLGPSLRSNVVATASAPCDAPDALAHLRAGLGAGPFSLVLFFVSPRADFRAFVTEAAEAFDGAEVAACTTAGEICNGYTEGTIVAVGFCADHFCARVMVVDDMNALDGDALVRRMMAIRNTLITEKPDWDEEFDFLMVDGLSMAEDQLTAMLAPGLGSAHLFGGSAGDGVNFGATFVAHGARVMERAAVLAMVRTRCRLTVFKADHLSPTECRMVVTGADPARRLVREINAEPAAREYARILGKDPNQLDTFTFAAHPVVVRMGGEHHVRSIQRVTPEGELIFFCAIDEGMVLTLAEPEDMARHLAEELERLSRPVSPALILACDCILRRKEAEDKQVVGALSSLLAKHRVVGFNTYGEQLGALHVNQTLTGVAIYPPASGYAP